MFGDVEDGWRPSRLYRLDENLDLASSEPLGSLDNQVFFLANQWFRLYPTPREGELSPSIEMCVNSKGLPTVVFEFCPEATPVQLEHLWEYVQREATLARLAKWWGQIQVRWGVPRARKELANNALTIYFDAEGGWAFLTAIATLPKTYRDLLGDYARLRDVFEASQP